MKYVAYYRVSTARQGRSGLGLEAQRECVEASASDGSIIGEFTEVESGKRKDRPQLTEAVELCKREGATLIIAKLDRLTRSVSFVFQLRDSGVKFRACDLPEFNTLTLGIAATFAQGEREKIAERTKAALDAKRAKVGEWRVSNLTDEARKRGVLGNMKRAENNENLKRARALVSALNSEGLSLQKIADRLNEAGYKTSKGKEFTRMQVKRIKDKL